jgi:hypothetical protein
MGLTSILWALTDDGKEFRGVENDAIVDFAADPDSVLGTSFAREEGTEKLTC